MLLKKVQNALRGKVGGKKLSALLNVAYYTCTALPGFIRLPLVLYKYVEIKEGLKKNIPYGQKESKISLVLATKG